MAFGDHMHTAVLACCLLSLTGSVMWYNACANPGTTNTSAVVTAGSQQLQSVKSNIRVFVGILSRSGSREARQAIRTTWGADERLARVMFFTLRPRSEAAFRALRSEAADYGDLVVTSEALESYHNATYSMISMMRAAAGMGDQITHVLKTDEDCFVRVSLLLGALEAMPTQWLYAGRITQIQVNRNAQYRWFVPVSNWASNDTITYTWGMATVLSRDLVRHLAAGAVHVSMPPGNMLWVEDLAVGVWVAQIAKERRVAINYDSRLKCSAQECRDYDVVTANLQQPLPEAMQCLHQSNGQCCGTRTVTQESQKWAPAETQRAR